MFFHTILTLLMVASTYSYVIPASRGIHQRRFYQRLNAENGAQVSDVGPEKSSPLIDLQTFLKLADVVESGGQAKVIIQAGEVFVNRQVETRRAKKLFEGDVVAVNELDEVFDVFKYVSSKDYIYPVKDKKEKKEKKKDEEEFKGEFRSEEWREARKKKKYERKAEKGKEKGTLKVWRFDSERGSGGGSSDEASIKVIQEKVVEREAYRQARKYDEADDVRVYLEMDYSVQLDDDSRIWYFEKE